MTLDPIITNAMTDILDSPLGEDAVYTTLAGVASNIRVFFHEEYLSDLGVESYDIYVEALTSDVSAAQKDETITVRGTTYKIKEPPHNEDNGMSVVNLIID